MSATLRGADGSVFVQQGEFLDEELKVKSWPSEAKDGRIHCLPGGEDLIYEAGGYYDDPDCQETVLSITSPESCTAVPSFRRKPSSLSST